MKAQAAYLSVQCGNRDELVTRYAPLVKRLAYHLIARLPASVDVDDLIQDGMIGLLEAAGNYQPDRGASFETFASLRIRGAMLDQIRRSGWAPRSVSQQMRRVSEAIHRVENRLGREAQPEEVAKDMGIDVDEYHAILRDSSSIRLFSLDQVSDDEKELLAPEEGSRDNPLSEVLDDGFRKDLSKAIGGLPEREKLVMTLYYDTGLNLKEIGAVIEVSESRVSQIHSQAIVRLRSRLNDWNAA